MLLSKPIRAMAAGSAAAGALSGLVIGFVFARWISLNQPRHQNLPYIARQCGGGDS